MSEGTSSETVFQGAHHEPVQARARVTFERILKVAIDILATEGVAALNTNKVAERAGINIATLYAYFPNKEGIVAHLGQRFEDKRATSIEEHAAELGASPDWRRWFADSIDSMVQFRIDEPGGLAVRQALMALPELRELDRMSTRRAIEAKLPGLMKLGPELTEEKARLISTVYTVTVTAVLDEAFLQTPYDQGAIEELKRMVFAYFETYLPASSEA